MQICTITPIPLPVNPKRSAFFIWVTGTDTQAPQLVFNANGPEPCADGATDFAEIRGCLEPSEVAKVSNVPGEGFGVGYNSDMRQVCGTENLFAQSIARARLLTSEP